MIDSYDWDNVDMDMVLDNSYKDFHAKGFDYLCLHRSPKLTVKAYFFAEGMESQKAGEVVNPHDHRYSFTTQCLSGVIENQWYRVPPCWDGESVGDECGQLYNVYDYRTPLLGGNGFTQVDSGVPLQRHKVQQFSRGRAYYMRAEQFHTIRVAAPETCILLEQFEDEVPEDQPTLTFTRDELPPNTSGLYSRFTADEAVDRLALLRRLIER